MECTERNATCKFVLFFFLYTFVPSRLSPLSPTCLPLPLRVRLSNFHRSLFGVFSTCLPLSFDYATFVYLVDHDLTCSLFSFSSSPPWLPSAIVAAPHQAQHPNSLSSLMALSRGRATAALQLHLSKLKLLAQERNMLNIYMPTTSIFPKQASSQTPASVKVPSERRN
jgi:hypothetical protein